MNTELKFISMSWLLTWCYRVVIQTA